MRDAIDAARDIECSLMGEWCLTHESEWPCNSPTVRAFADIIRERDVEVQIKALQDTVTAFLAECDSEDIWVAAWMQMRIDDLERRQREHRP